jgi:cbb3-type cytochrome oxidase maturation protein
MEIIRLLLPIALVIAGGFLAAYIWAVRTGQFDDTTTPAYRILIEEEPEEGKRKNDETSKN